jgi:hypothetical protein
VAQGRGGGRSPFQIVLRASERRWLKTMVRKPTAQQRQVTRARIVLLAAAGWTNAAIARKLEIAPNTAAKWRKRYVQQGVERLADRKRPGRPRGFTAPVVAEVKAIACELPATRGVPLSGGASRSCARKSAPAGWSRTFRPPRWAAGWPRMPSGRGGTTPGSSLVTRRSGPRPPECWTCTKASSTAGPSVKTSTSPGGPRPGEQTWRSGWRWRCSTSSSATDGWSTTPAGTETPSRPSKLPGTTTSKRDHYGRRFAGKLRQPGHHRGWAVPFSGTARPGRQR